jgi:DNA polymerase III alpha subunit
MADSFISLHNRSAYSFGSALTTPKQLVAFAAAQHMPAIALTDLNGLYAAVQFQQACHEAGVKPIFGAELSLCRESLLGTTSAANPFASAASLTVTLLTQNLSGYGNLCRLISLHHLREQPLDASDLCEHAPGLICLLGSVGPPWPTWNTEKPSRSAKTPIANGAKNCDFHIANLRDAFQNRLYIELSIHQPSDAALARRRAKLADSLGLPVVATCESRCTSRDQALALKALASIGTLTLLDQPHPDKPDGAWHLRTPAEMQRLFARRPDALANTRIIADQCNVTLDLSQSRFPGFASPDGRSAIEHLRALAVAGCRRRYVDEPPLRGIGGYRPTLDEALARLERELSIIEQVHYAEYFLVFHEIAEYCRREGISFLARGSAADSLVCYALGVSHACPFRFDLPFDRFINPERAKFSKMADIDLDLPWDQRDQVIRWVYDRWGHDRVAMIGSANTFHARAAVAELGKVYGLPAHEVHRVTKLLPYTRIWNLPDAIAQSPESQELLTSHSASTIGAEPTIRTAPVRKRPGGSGTPPVPHLPAVGGSDRTGPLPHPDGHRDGSDSDSGVTLDEPYATILQLACHLDGLPRHWAMHPCGLVVSPEPLTDLVPVQRSPKGMLIAQYDMDAIEDLGFVKIDLLGQAGLSVLRDAVNEINRTQIRPNNSWQIRPEGAADRSHGWSPDPDPRRDRDETRGNRACNSLSAPAGAEAAIDNKAVYHSSTASFNGTACGTTNVDTLPLSELSDSTIHLPPNAIPLVDLTRDVDYSEPETWNMIATGNARGVHHIESPAMTSLIQQCNCRDIDCLTAVVAIIRPGAANQGKKEAFARRYQNLEAPSYAHPSLVAPLEKTYGLMVFEEHILQVAVEFAGMNLGRADVLRRALNKQNLPLIAELKSEFRACALQIGRRPDEIDIVWPFVEGFAGFMFNKAHSAEYAVEAFQGAWLKRRWPAHYIAAILSNYRGFYASSPTLPQILYVMEAHRLGFRFLPPCVNRSREHFSVEPSPLWCSHPGCAPAVGCTQALEGRQEPAAAFSNLKSEISNLRSLAIRVPVSHIASLSQSFLDRYAAARANGPFASIADFVDRCRPTESEAQSLLDAGAFDCLGAPGQSLIGANAGTAVPNQSPSGSEGHRGEASGNEEYRGEASGSEEHRGEASGSEGYGGKERAGLEHAPRSRPGSDREHAIARFRSSRPAMFWQLRKLLRRAAASGPSLWSALDRERAALSTQHSALSTGHSASAALDRDDTAPPIEFTEPDIRQIAQREMDLLGFPITLDPLTFLSRDDKGRQIDWSRYVPVEQLGRHLRRRVAVCGLMVADRVNATTTGDLMKFVTLADRTGFIETILFPDAYQRFGHLTVANPILAATGIVEPYENNNGFTLRVQQVSPPQRLRVPEGRPIVAQRETLGHPALRVTPSRRDG